MTISASQLLTEARTMITSRSDWTVQYPARAFDDSPVDVFDHRACKFCVHGALMRVRKNHQLHEGFTAPPVRAAYRYLADAARAMYGHGRTSAINDFRGHDAILTVLDSAIDSARANHA